ncbi:hypothetical protein OsI_26012 [Oryza sativa Indica Group]|uniref:Uncharacterized protein n=1 Tax=Oryza sativa subsp. indica TaxID=39946 RepID=B8B625_ORYSI|nr:hypothetical protein OsI_26012 [Oryza sativa Indica Group]
MAVEGHITDKIHRCLAMDGLRPRVLQCGKVRSLLQCGSCLPLTKSGLEKFGLNQCNGQFIEDFKQWKKETSTTATGLKFGLRYRS